MKIKVIGKIHRSGTSKKTGKDYNFVELHYLGHERGVEGDAACRVTIDPGLYPYAKILLGTEYNIEFDQRGFAVGFEPVC